MKQCKDLENIEEAKRLLRDNHRKESEVAGRGPTLCNPSYYQLLRM